MLNANVTYFGVKNVTKKFVNFLSYPYPYSFSYSFSFL